MIDCQQETSHLASLGARPIPRDDFIRSIQRQQQLSAMRWQADPENWQLLGLDIHQYHKDTNDIEYFT